MLKTIAFTVVLLMFHTSAHAFIWGLLGRGAVVRGTAGAAVRAGSAEAAAGARVVGQANRAGATSRDFTWVEREVTKALIQRAIRGESATRDESRDVAVPETDCLTVEYDGHFNFVANYCRTSVEVIQFAQHDPQTGSVKLVGCRPACVIHPAQYMRFPPLGPVGPFVSVQSRELRSDPNYTPPQGNTPSTTSPQVLPTGVVCGPAAYNMLCPSIAISGTDCRRCQ